MAELAHILEFKKEFAKMGNEFIGIEKCAVSAETVARRKSNADN